MACGCDLSNQHDSYANYDPTPHFHITQLAVKPTTSPVTPRHEHIMRWTIATRTASSSPDRTTYPPSGQHRNSLPRPTRPSPNYTHGRHPHRTGNIRDALSPYARSRVRHPPNSRSCLRAGDNVERKGRICIG